MLSNLKKIVVFLISVLLIQSCFFKKANSRIKLKTAKETQIIQDNNKVNCNFFNSNNYYKHFVYQENNQPQIEFNLNFSENDIEGEIFDYSDNQYYKVESKLIEKNKFSLKCYSSIGVQLDNIECKIKNDTILEIKSSLFENQNIILMESYPESLKFEKYCSEQVYHLFGTDSLRYCTINLLYYDPVKCNLYCDIQKIRKIIQKSYFNTDYEDVSPCKYLQSIQTDFIGIYKELENGEIIDNIYYYVWNYDLSMNIILNSKNILSYCISDYNYTGGAHGSSTSNYYNISLKNSEILSLEDIFIANYEEKLKEKILQSLITYFNVNTKQELDEFLFSYESVYLTNNFYLTNVGICFVYNEYDIAPYVTGQIKAFIEFSELKDILKQNFPLII